MNSWRISKLCLIPTPTLSSKERISFTLTTKLSFRSRIDFDHRENLWWKCNTTLAKLLKPFYWSIKYRNLLKPALVLTLTRLLPSNGIGSVESSIGDKKLSAELTEGSEVLHSVFAVSQLPEFTSTDRHEGSTYTYKSVRMSLFHFHFEITHVIFQMV